MQFVLNCIAPLNHKIKLGVKGRSETFDILKNNLSTQDKTLWFHCASLGEYEQGLPVFKELKKKYTNHKVVLTFFSPSGYEIRKNSPIADVVAYLPMDTKKNAKRFLNLVHPELTVFVKYDIWPNYLNELNKRQLRALLISASFRPYQPYFKWHGLLLRKALFAFEHIFTQNDSSKTLLESINYLNATISGDTRFDRVSDQLNQNNSLDFIENFKQNKLCVVAGSTWPEDEALFINFINSEASKGTKFIIAPHNIKTSQIASLQEKLTADTVLYSQKEGHDCSKAQVFIIDTIGLLSKIYSYADIAYVGGAMGQTGLHNTLEPAVFGVPIIIGSHHSKFPEAKAMIDNSGMFSISNQQEFNSILNDLITNKQKRKTSGNHNSEYILKNKGAVEHVLNYLHLQ
ncbi:3-deoxy-D-manno-octulosonic acid transferase [Yeosuana aromativorans]|uniref:3-deoxy-D-manno-octulosonic acid transferase n=1 Tax=Yeosuana aromativorans TaxID=288019 RepID=A0A8J3BCP7_9FLAO|nr:glycosyltransferase N-terminal domain-containing protein [Yeosuana aromativorans]GGK12054.1 3-deoxy-D-manno-octulosonic acid transferase [Yeosuana aromativorans]